MHRVAETQGGKIRFENVEREEPIGELSAYDVKAGEEPPGSARLTYRLAPGGGEAMRAFIDGRFTADERVTMSAVPEGAAASARARRRRDCRWSTSSSRRRAGRRSTTGSTA